MAMVVEVVRSVEDVDREEYLALAEAAGAPLFYDWRFLDAVERSPLLPVEDTRYLLVRDAGRLVAFMPAYLQVVSAVDPLGLLARNAGIDGGHGHRALFSHVMHCFDSRVIAMPGRSDALPALMRAATGLAVELEARYVGLLNVADTGLLARMPACGMVVRPLVDRYWMDLSRFRDFDTLVAALPRDGRHEMNRQLRKHAASGATFEFLAPPFDDRLERLAALCQATTARNGTPRYFPAVALARFVRLCGGLARLAMVEREGELLGGFVCFVHGHTVCLWAAGMRYDLADVSPYTVGVAQIYRWALSQGIRTIEAGRLNERIKHRLGLVPLPLYAATREVPSSSKSSRIAPQRKEAHHGIASQ